MLIKLHEMHVNTQLQAELEAALGQIVRARDLLLRAARKSERREAIAETFETFDVLDPLLPEAVQLFIT